MNFKNLLGIFVLFCLIGFAVIYNNDSNARQFEFSYSVTFKPTNGKKFEAWIPYPQSNEVQDISNIQIDTDLNYEILDESKHGNKYVYLYSLEGLESDSDFKLSCDVDRMENLSVDFSDVNKSNYLEGSQRVGVGRVFGDVISENNLSADNMRNVYDYVLDGMHYGKPTDDEDSENYKYIHGGVNPKTGKDWLPEYVTYGRRNVAKDELVKYQFHQREYAYGHGNSVYACDIGVGNCTDYHSYFISLSRTLGVPARFHMGFPIPEGDEGKVGCPPPCGP